MGRGGRKQRVGHAEEHGDDVHDVGAHDHLATAGVVPALEWVAIGLLIMGFLWFRPDGVRPEPRRVFEGGPDVE